MDYVLVVVHIVMNEKWNYHAIQQNNANKRTDMDDIIKIVSLFKNQAFLMLSSGLISYHETLLPYNPY